MLDVYAVLVSIISGCASRQTMFVCFSSPCLLKSFITKPRLFDAPSWNKEKNIKGNIQKVIFLIFPQNYAMGTH